MAKTLKDFLEGYLKVKSADEQKFIDKHVTAKNPDRNGNGDDVFKGSTKTIDRRKDRKGYNPGEDEKVYEGYYVMRNGQSISYHQDKETADKHARTSNMRGGPRATVVKDDRSVKEELKGNQHKIDANKNGKVDAHDFKLLRKKKKVAEEAEELDELSKSTMGAYTKKAAADFTSRKPKMGYDGQLKKMQNRTVGVNRALDKMYGEEAEQIDELEKKTLGSYIKKASGAEQPKNVMSPKNVPLTKIAAYQGDSETGHFGSRFNQATYDKAERLRKNRETGIKRATDKLTKEEVEDLEELSKATLGSYVKKAKDQMSRSDQIAGIELGQRHMGARPGNKERKHNQRASKRYFGIDKAVDKLTKEEVELEEKLTAKTPMGTYIKDFKKSDAPQFKGKSQDKRRVMAIAAKLSAERGGKPLRKEERLQNRINDLTETHQRTLMHVFEKLSEDNKSKFLEACDTPEGVEQMLDFAINNRGE